MGKLNANDLQKWSIAVRTRDNFKCKSCGSKRKLHAHHLVSKYYRPRYAFLLNNGITLCKKCHLGPNGVHGRAKPKSIFIKQLRDIYYSKNIKAAITLTDKF